MILNQLTQFNFKNYGMNSSMLLDILILDFACDYLGITILQPVNLLNGVCLLSV